jgi:ABC-type multidrug transport system permease subunit
MPTLNVGIPKNPYVLYFGVLLVIAAIGAAYYFYAPFQGLVILAVGSGLNLIEWSLVATIFGVPAFIPIIIFNDAILIVVGILIHRRQTQYRKQVTAEETAALYGSKGKTFNEPEAPPKPIPT